jgi:hypothetical protein
MKTEITEHELIYESEAARVYWDRQARAVEFEALYCMSGEGLRSTLERTWALIKERRARKLLVRMPRMGGIEVEPFLRVYADWMPRLFEEGLEYLVVVTPGPVDSPDEKPEESGWGLDQGAGELEGELCPSLDSVREWLKGH